jgi:two-component system C4-dicarboxylate transport response regulator DctD
MKPGVVLLVDDEDEIRRSTAQALQLAGFTVSDFASAEAVLDYVTPGFNGVVVSDIRMPGMDGMSLLGKVRDIDADLPVILVTGHGDVQLAVRAMREGAYDFIEKPFDTQHLADVTARALDRRGLVLENRLLRAAAGKSDDLEARLPGRSPAMIDLRYRLRALAGTDADVLIVGETGVGKEVAARALHDISSRAARPFVAIDCAALPASLIESELFGHEAGAFPGALRPRYGKFEHARGGTLLLDEIGSMPADIQAKLLRVLEERVVVRLGSNEPIPLDVRFIATNKAELADEVAAGRFRADLYYRLNVVTLRIPPLAERMLRCSFCCWRARRPGATGAISPRRRRMSWPRSPSATGRAMCASCATPPTATCLGWKAVRANPPPTAARRGWPSASPVSSAPSSPPPCTSTAAA